MKVTIIGGGKVGYYLAKTLIEHGHEPSIIELDKKTAEFIANDLDIRVTCGDGTHIDTLDEAGVINTEVVIAVSGQDENNLIACQLARKIYNVKKTVARVNNPKNVEVMKKLGIDNVISSTDKIAELLEREAGTSKIRELVYLNHGTGAIAEILLPENYYFDGKMLVDIDIPQSVNIISIERDNTLIIPRGMTELKSGDRLLIIKGNISDAKLEAVLKLS